MSDFEREVVHCFNRFFETHHIHGFAYRLKQHKFSTQYVDVLVDCINPTYYCAVECKSIMDKKLYFSQHFHSDKKNVHQVNAISYFLEKTGRVGYLAVEFRTAGKPNEAFLIPWDIIKEHFHENRGIAIDDARRGTALVRSHGAYVLDTLNAK